jgi:serine protease Do
VLTNNHVVEGASRIQVVLFPDPDARPSDARRLEATVLGRDPFTDSALLQLKESSNLPVAPLGNSDAMRPGDWVMAIGNPFALSHTVTVGVVSATARPFPLEGRPQRMLQTDAAVNPGNSGGPLINLRGEVVGVNTAIFSPLGAQGGNVGIGFAVPINLVQELIPQLRKGNVRRARLGVEIRDVPAEAADDLGLKGAQGALVTSVESDGPADRAGLEPGDVIVQFRGEAIDNADELVATVAASAPGNPAPVTVVRGGDRETLNVTLGELSAPDAPASSQDEGTERFGMTLRAIPADAARQLGLEPGQGGGMIAAVTPASPAAEAGLQPGDVVLEVNRQPVNALSATIDRLEEIDAGESASLLVLRGNRRVFVLLTRPA